MDYTLVLVGGTGQRFGVVVGWLNVLGLLEPPGRVVIVDAEGAPGQHAGLGTDPEYLTRFGKPGCKVLRYLPYSTPRHALAAGQQVGMGEQRVARAVDLVGHMGSPFWDLCLPRDEQEMDIQRGFYAKPRLASTVFWNDILLERNGLVVQELAQGTHASEKHIVVIVGSLSGGTGAGLIPLIAKLYRERARVEGLYAICFAKYFSTAGRPDAPSDEQLRDNAANGARFFLDECLPHLDGGILLGVPRHAKVPQADDKVHLYPGFLAAAMLLSKSGEDLHNWWQDKRQGKQDCPRLALLAVRGDDAYLHGDDVHFPFRLEKGTTIMGGNDLHGLAEAVQSELERFAQHPLLDCLGPLTLYPRRRMGPAIFDTLAKVGRGKVYPTTAKSFEDAAQEHIGKAGRALRALQAWLADLNRELLPGTGNAKFFDSGASKRVVRKEWRKAIEPIKEFGEVDPAEVAIQTWVRQIGKACQSPGKAGAPTPDQRVWALDFTCTQPPQNLGFELVHPSAVDPFTSVPADSVRGSSYPSPLGEAHAFAAKLKAGDQESLETARLLWRGLALGLLTIENYDLLKGGSDFERVIYKAERNGFNRFFGVIKTAVPVLDTRDNSVLIPAGTPIGGTHPKCGLWPGVASGPMIEKMAQALSSGERRAQADSVLTSFYLSLNQEWGECDGPLKAILGPIALETARGTQSNVPARDLATDAPLLIQTSWNDNQPVLVYPFVWFPGRYQLLRAILRLLIAGKIQILSSAASSELSLVSEDGTKIALLDARREFRDNQPDDLASKFLGCGAFKVLGEVVSIRPSPGELPREFQQAVDVIRNVFKGELSDHRRFQHRLPDFLWHDELLRGDVVSEQQ